MGTIRKKYDMNLIRLISLFEKTTHADVKDCINDDDQLIFVVAPFQLRKCLGKDGSNIKRLNSELNKRIKIVEYSDDIREFIKSLIMPLKVDSIEVDDGIVTLKSEDRKVKGLLIGKNARNLRRYERVVQRFFDIKEMKVV